jgi:hypothetical protein
MGRHIIPQNIFTSGRADHEIASICATIGIIAAKPRFWARNFSVFKATRAKFPTHEKTKNRKLDYPKIIFHHPVSENNGAKRGAKRHLAA